MNREQRRRAAKAPAPAPLKTFQTKYAITETHVVVVFPYPVPNIQMTPAQVDDMIAQLQAGKAALAERMVTRTANV